MKIVSRITGRFLLFINADELIPAGDVHLPDAVPRTGLRYQFASLPNLNAPWKEILENGIKFEQGKFIPENDPEQPEHLIQDLTIYQNGVVITAATTDIAELFVSDFFEWGSKSIRMNVPLHVFKQRAYLSELVVEFETPIDNGLQRYNTLMEAIGGALNKTYQFEFPRISVSGLTFAYDKAVAPYEFQSLAPFWIDRRANRRFSENVFYCGAPLRTDDHIRLLTQFEEILAKK